MNPNENHLFDELIRQKLEGYSEPPEMSLMSGIHAKKSRVLRWYGLYRIMLVSTAIGLGLLGTYFGIQMTGEEAARAVVSPVSTQVPARSESSGNDVTTNLNSASGVKSTAKASESNKNNGWITYPPTHSSVRSKSGSQTGKSQLPATRTEKKTDQPFPSNQNLNQSPKGNTTTPVGSDKTTSSENDIKKSSTGADECVALFNYYKSFTGEFQFNDLSAVSGIVNYAWDFGDGSGSNHRSPVHRYEKSGSYPVQLTITGANGCTQTVSKALTYTAEGTENHQPRKVLGVVRAGNTPLGNALVEFISQMNGTDEQVSYLIRTNKNGEFEQSGIKPGRYLLVAYPNEEASGYVKTYWGNEMDMNSAPEIVITAGDNDHLGTYSIDLVYVGTENDRKNVNGADIAQISTRQVILFDENNNIVGYGTVDQNGKITYNGSVSGKFKVFDQESGAVRGIVELDNDPSGGTSSSSGTLKDNQQEMAANKVMLNPNPAADFVKVNMESATSSEIVGVYVLDANGKEMLNGMGASDNPGQVSVDISKLPAGVYYVMVMLKDGTLTSTRLLKTEPSRGFEH